MVAGERLPPLPVHRARALQQSQFTQFHSLPAFLILALALALVQDLAPAPALVQDLAPALALALVQDLAPAPALALVQDLAPALALALALVQDLVPVPAPAPALVQDLAPALAFLLVQILVLARAPAQILLPIGGYRQGNALTAPMFNHWVNQWGRS